MTRGHSRPAGSRLRDADDQRIALPTATAQRSGPYPATPTLQLERQVQHDPCPRHPDRVSEGDRAAVDVDPVLSHAELAGAGDPDRGERLIDLDQLELRGGDSLLLARDSDGA